MRGRTDDEHVGQHAIVIGASMGGLAAAAIGFPVLERDALPRSDIPRKGVPQGRHALAGALPAVPNLAAGA